MLPSGQTKKKWVSFLFSGIFHLEEIGQVHSWNFHEPACFMVGSGENPIEQIHGVIFFGPYKWPTPKRVSLGL